MENDSEINLICESNASNCKWIQIQKISSTQGQVLLKFYKKNSSKMAQMLSNLKDQLNISLHDSSKPWTSVLAKAENKTNLNRLYIFLGSTAIIGLWLVFGYCAQLVCNIVGFLYPAYVSIHAIESKRKDDDTKWLTYWVVFALFSIVEYFADLIVRWFPLYWLVKCVFMVWLMIPTEFNGSLFLYQKIIKPYFLKHHQTIDDTLNKVKESATKILEKNE